MADANRRTKKVKQEKPKISRREKAEKKELSSKDIAFKNTLIIVLLLVCLVETVYIVFFTLNLKENSVKKSFLTIYVDLQKDVSTYLSNKNFELYGAYNYAQILTGTVIGENEEKQDITDVNGEKLTALVVENSKMEIGEVEYYIVNMDNIKTLLKDEIPAYLHGITWYIGSDGSIKIKYGLKPGWWTSDLDGLLLGN